MRIKRLIPLLGAIALTAVCASSGGGAVTPKIAAKQAEAKRVLEEISAIDEQLNSVSERYDGAKVQFDKARKSLVSEQIALTAARVRFHRSQHRAAKLLVWMYTSNHTSSLDVLLGAHSLGELLALSDAEHQVSSQATLIAHQTEAAKHSLSVKVIQLNHDRAAAAAALHQLARARTQILNGLAERRQLLASVQQEVNHLEAVERARQAQLAAEARARLAAELAAQRKAASEAAAARRAELANAARAKAKAAANAAAASHTNSAEAAGPSGSTGPAAPSTPSGATGPNASTAPPPEASVLTPATAPTIAPTPAATTPDATIPAITTPAFIPSGPLPAGHPEAAQLALAYLGVPYLWGGSTPDGFDCSGLVSYVYAQLGVALPHFAAAQWGFGATVPVEDLQPGDLVFFDKLDHVGIYLGNDEFINAPHTGAFVRIDTLSEPWYRKHYVGARRI